MALFRDLLRLPLTLAKPHYFNYRARGVCIYREPAQDVIRWRSEGGGANKCHEATAGGRSGPRCKERRGDGYGGVPLAARSLLQYGITPIDSAKTDVTMQFYVENQL